MKNFDNPRFDEKIYYEKPTRSPLGEKKFFVGSITSVNDRINHFPNNGEYESEEDVPEKTGTLFERHAIPLKEIMERIRFNQINIDDVFITASLSEDYINVEAVYINQLSEEEKEFLYNKELSEWEAQEKIKNDAERNDIERKIAYLSKRLEQVK